MAQFNFDITPVPSNPAQAEAERETEEEIGTRLATAYAQSVLDLLSQHNPEDWLRNRNEILDAVATLGETFILTAGTVGKYADKFGKL